MTKRLLITSLALSLAILAPLGAGFVVALLLSQPDREHPPALPRHLPVETVHIESPSGRRLVAWLATPPLPRAAAVLLHGLRADRREMLGRARILHAEGYAVLMPDLQAHGESEGTRITFGYLESRDAIGASAFMRRRFPDLPVVGIGLSLGGAAFALAGERNDTNALVLEAAYPTIEQAVANRVSQRLDVAHGFATGLLLLQLRPLLAIGPEELRPVDRIGKVHCPVLVISGTEDPLTTEAQTRELFVAAPTPRELWLVPGATHQDLLRHSGDAYRQRVLGFLSRHIGVPVPSAPDPPIPPR